MQRINNRFLLKVNTYSWVFTADSSQQNKIKKYFNLIDFIQAESGKVNEITSRTFHNVSSFKS